MKDKWEEILMRRGDLTKSEIKYLDFRERMRLFWLVIVPFAAVSVVVVFLILSLYKWQLENAECMTEIEYQEWYDSKKKGGE